MTDTRTLRTPAEARMAMDGQQNAGGQRHVIRDGGGVYYDEAPRAEYPRMMYKATTVEQTQEHADAMSELKEGPMVINRFAGQYLCETMIARDAAEAEVLATNGWDLTPAAAHGAEVGLVAATTAKDDRIAELERQLSARNAEQEPQKRGPGRPRSIEGVE